MNCKTITERLKRVAAIVDSWKGENGVPQIERDIVLGELRDVYNALLVVELDAVESGEGESANLVAAESEKVAVEERETTLKEEVGTEPSSMKAFYDALDIDALLGLNDEPAVEQPAIEEVAAVEPNESISVDENIAEVVESEPIPVAQPEEERLEEAVANVVEEPTPEPAADSTPEPTLELSPEPIVQEVKPLGTGLFDLDDIPVRSKSRRKMISLYSDDPMPQQSVAEPPHVEPKVEQSAPRVEVEQEVDATPRVESLSVADLISSAPQQRLGDSFGEVKTLADQMAKDGGPTTPFNRITTLRQAIGLNDKFLMIRDLFGGDAERYEATIDTLDEFDDLDECIIYIVENFRWNPDLEAAKLLVSLIERKLA